jgi:hypothetical protein
MTFEQEMSRFFKGYSTGARHKVEAWPPYIEAARKRDVVNAQLIALEVIQQDYPKDKKLAKAMGPYYDP